MVLSLELPRQRAPEDQERRQRPPDRTSAIKRHLTQAARSAEKPQSLRSRWAGERSPHCPSRAAAPPSVGQGRHCGLWVSSTNLQGQRPPTCMVMLSALSWSAKHSLKFHFVLLAQEKQALSLFRQLRANPPELQKRVQAQRWVVQGREAGFRPASELPSPHLKCGTPEPVHPGDGVANTSPPPGAGLPTCIITQ